MDMDGGMLWKAAWDKQGWEPFLYDWKSSEVLFASSVWVPPSSEALEFKDLSKMAVAIRPSRRK